MMRRVMVVLSLALSQLFLVPVAASATECTPKGCTGGCYGGDVQIDPDTMTVVIQPIECYS